MSDFIRRWILAGPADAMKTEIVMRSLNTSSIIQSRPYVFLCEKKSGRAVDCAQELGNEVFVTSDPHFRSDESQEELDKIEADLIVSCGWNYIFPQHVFTRFKYPCINCHSSLLPDYKGQRAYVHQWANCESRYGITIHFISNKLDEGKMLLQSEMKLFPDESIVIMHRRISELTGALLPLALLLIETGYKGKDYDVSAKSRYFYKISSRKAQIHRSCNKVLSALGLPLWLTPHKNRQTSS